ncbi:MAG: cellulose synthase operon domain protein, partial [Variovorax sp.]|nr:cellulose synthase operon domain protein [Variovorax sp.]
MSFRTTDVNTVSPAPFALSPASRWIARLGLLGALCTGGSAFAQSDASSALIEQGNYWQSLGRAELAEESWKKLLRVDPKSADAMYGMAQVELTRGNAEAARSWITQLQAAHPTDPRVARLQQQSRQPGAPASDLQRARAAAQAGRSAEAVQLYRALFDNRPPPAPLALEFYEVLGGTPQGYDEARKGIEQLTKDQPTNLNAKLSLAQLDTYREPSRRDGIKQLADLSKQPTVAARAKASWRQALIWLDARAPDAQLYQDYLAGQPDPAVSARLETLTVARTASTASPAAQPLGEGFKALDRGDNAVAEQRFQQALRAQPGDSEALGGLGLIRLKQERFAEAEQLLQQASKAPNGTKWASALRSASYWTLMGQATAAREKNDTTTARSLLERAVRLDAREPVGQNALADLRLAAGQFSEAEQGYRRVLESKPADTQALRGLITVYTRQGRAADALALSEKLTPEQAAQVGSLQDVRVEQARAQARAQIEAGDNAGAQRTLEDAMLAAPDSPWVRLDLANIYRRNGLMAQARGVMDGLLMSQPDMPDALYASALLASDAGDPAAGLQYLDRIPANARTRDMSTLQRRLWAQGQAQRAQALAKQGQVAAARGVLAQTEATLSANMPSELWGQLASAYAEIGDAPRALAMSRQLLTRTPNPGIGDRLLYASILLKTQQDIELSAVLRQLQAANMTAAQRSDFDSLRVAFTLRQTDALRDAGNLEAAYNAMAPLVAERPNDPQVMAALARLYSAARDERQALALYQRILQRSPTDLDTLIAAAGSASALRDHGEADSYVAAALKQAPDQSRVLAAAGRVYRNAGDNAQAEQYLRAAVAADARAANGSAFASAQGGGMAMPAANPFAGMTGGAASAMSAPGSGSPFAGMTRVSMPAGGSAYPPAGYPAAQGYPVAQAAAPYPGAVYPAAVYPAASYPGAPAAAAAGYPVAGMPWPGTPPVTQARSATTRNTTTAAARKRGSTGGAANPNTGADPA